MKNATNPGELIEIEPDALPKNDEKNPTDAAEDKEEDEESTKNTSIQEQKQEQQSEDQEQIIEPITPRKVSRFGAGPCATIRGFFTSRIFLVISAIIVITATVISTVIKYIVSQYKRKDTEGNTFLELPEAINIVVIFLIVVYLILFAYFLFEYCAKVLSFGCKRFYYSSESGIKISNILDAVIIAIDFGLGVFTLILWRQESRIVPLFGSFITLRLLVMMTSIPSLNAIVDGLKRAFAVIVIILFFGLVALYGFVLAAYVLFSPDVFSGNANCEMCMERFYSIEVTLFAMFQIATGDAWYDNVVLKVAQSSVFPPTFTNWFFIIYYCFAIFIILNILTAVIVDNITNDEAYYSMPQRSPWQSFLYYLSRLIRRYEDPVISQQLRSVDEIDVDGLIIPKSTNKKKEYEELKLQMEARFRKDIRFQLEGIHTLQKSLLAKLGRVQNSRPRRSALFIAPKSDNNSKIGNLLTMMKK